MENLKRKSESAKSITKEFATELDVTFVPTSLLRYARKTSKDYASSLTLGVLGSLELARLSIYVAIINQIIY